MPVLLLLAHTALCMVAPPMTLSIPPPVVFPGARTTAPTVETDAFDYGMATKLGSAENLAHTLRTHHRMSSFVDADQPAPGPPGGGSAEGGETAHQVLTALNTQMKKVKEDMTALEDAHHQNQVMVSNLEDAAKIDQQLEQTNRNQINNLVKIYAGLNHQVVKEEHIQGAASALQQDVKVEAGELVNAASEESRELESTDQNRDTQKVQLDALTGTLFNKIQTGQAHQNTLTAWAMRVAYQTNVATSEMEQLRGDLLVLDDSMNSMSDNLLGLFRQVQTAAPKKAET